MVNVEQNDVELLRQLNSDDPAKHKCELHHDSGYLSPAQVVELGMKGFILPSSNGSGDYYRPLCAEVGVSPSVACAHDARYRRAMINVLCFVGPILADENCPDLVKEIREIEKYSIYNLDFDMALLRPDRSSGGEAKRKSIGKSHSDIVDRLFEINTITLNLYQQAIDRQRERMIPLHSHL
ncbi:MAG: hypothetical protein HOO67_00745 [Candidatus Peribacteraceae bacterium]|nr:hypothetical protein [Candidatus Peribacteraceae bacterium]